MDNTQVAMFDTSGKEYNAYFVDENQPLFVPNNPLHWKAHKLQILIQRLEKHAQTNPAQFNSKNYIEILNEYETLINKISQRGTNDTEPESVDQDRNDPTEEKVGERTPERVGSGVSTDNPFAG